MKTIIYLLLTIMMIPIIASSQDKKEEKKYGISVSGFVKNDFFYDTRQTVNAREGHFLLWPTAKKLDINGVDLNDNASFNFLSIQTRLTGKITGPDAFGAKTSGVIEGAFFGHSNADINGFRLRHAFVKLNWENAELLTGQYWHPLFETSCFPGVVSFNTGSGIQPFARNPQIRFTYKFGDLQMYAVAYSERDFTSRGPAGTNSSYIRNSGMPSEFVGFRYSKKKEDGTGFVAGFGGGTLTIQPQTVTGLGYKTNQLLRSINSNVYFRLNTKAVTLKIEGVYGGNMANMLLFGGYAIKDTLNFTTGEVEWEAINNVAFWLDVHSNGKKIQAGLFAGYNMNMGTSNEVLGGYQGLANSIKSVMRISPRVIFNSGKFRFATELEYTMAEYGDNTYDKFAIPQNTYNVSNLRVLFSTYYFF